MMEEVMSPLPSIQASQNFIEKLLFYTKNNFFRMASIINASNSDAERRCLRDGVLRTVKRNNGILVAKPSLVGRHTYLGRDILAKNSRKEPGYTDERGYVPVEWWLCSSVMAGNPVMKENEGIAKFFISMNDKEGSHEKNELRLFTDILEVAEEEVLGKYRHAWPLIKVLDIGGRATQPNFSGKLGPEEVPPIPCHVHNGYICDGRCCGHGKLEAYFFPPLPKGKEVRNAKTRLGVKPETSKATLLSCMRNFGINDDMYTHLNVFDVVPFSGFTIACGVIHAPGPYPTFEVQLPQDDGNLLAWQMGQKIETESELLEERQRSMLRSMKDESALFDEVVDMSLTSAADFKEKWFHPSKVIQDGDWGKRLQTFFNRFYGEAIEINPGHTFKLSKSEKPCAMVVWLGKGSINGISVNSQNQDARELLVVPNTELVISNTHKEEKLLLLSVYPFLPAVEKRSGICCAGLACVDYVIEGSGVIDRSTAHVFGKSYHRRAGGSVPNTSKTIASFQGVRCEALTMIGLDNDGDFLLSELAKGGIGNRYVARTERASTQVSFLPVYDNGERACIVVPGSSTLLDEAAILGEVGLGCKRIDMLRELLWINLGYPYELQKLQSSNLTRLCKRLAEIDIAISMDMNGASSMQLKENTAEIISGALKYVAVLHANIHEAVAFACSHDEHRVPKHVIDLCNQASADFSSITVDDLMLISSSFFEYNLGLLTITLGSAGSFIRVNSDAGILRRQFRCAWPVDGDSIAAGWVEESFAYEKPEVPKCTAINSTVGAGDAFLGGLLIGLESLVSKKVDVLSDFTLRALLKFAQSTAVSQIYGCSQMNQEVHAHENVR